MALYTFGFSVMGLVIYILQLAPNILWMRRPPANNVLSKNSSPHKILNILEAAFGIATVAALILVVSTSHAATNPLFLGLAVLFLLGYYVAWIFYYRGVVSPWLLIIGIAAMPPLYFFFAALWMNNYIALIPCIIFGVVHIAITCSTYLQPKA